MSKPSESQQEYQPTLTELEVIFAAIMRYLGAIDPTQDPPLSKQQLAKLRKLRDMFDAADREAERAERRARRRRSGHRRNALGAHRAA